MLIVKHILFKHNITRNKHFSFCQDHNTRNTFDLRHVVGKHIVLFKEKTWFVHEEEDEHNKHTQMYAVKQDCVVCMQLPLLSLLLQTICYYVCFSSLLIPCFLS